MSEGLDEIFVNFTKLSGAKTPEEMKQMNSTVCSKMVKDCLPKELENIVDTSVFPKYKESDKPYMLMKNFSEFVRGCAHEYAKLINKDLKLVETAPEVHNYYNEFLAKLREGVPELHELRLSRNQRRLSEGQVEAQTTSGCRETTSGCVVERRNSKKVTFKMEDE